jgi:transaldolase
VYNEIFGSGRFRELAGKGARTQRLLWASTSTKNPAYSDTKYNEPLIGSNTINTLPLETLTAYRDHGHPQRSLDQNISEACQILTDLSSVGVDLDVATQQLEQEGVGKFNTAFDQLMKSLQEKQAEILSTS